MMKSSRKKTEFKTELQEIFALDINSDNPDIHPERLCRSHEQLLLKYRDLKSQNEEWKFKTSASVAEFVPHSSNCTFCFTTPGRKRKRTGVKRSDFKPIKIVCSETNKTQLNDTTQPLLETVEPLPSVNQSDGYNSEDALFQSSKENETIEINEKITDEHEPLEFVHISKSDEDEDEETEIQLIMEKFKRLSSNGRLAILSRIVPVLSKPELNEIAYEVAKSQQAEISKDIERIFHQYGNKEFLITSNVSDWLLGRNKVLVRFIEGLSNVCLENLTETMKLSVCRIIEHIYGLRHLRLVAPFSFLLSLNIYTKTSSRIVVDLLSKISPSGSYNTVQKWISKSGSESPPCPQGTIMTAFDNEQVISFKRGITPNQKSRSSVITTQLHARMNNDGVNIQQNPTLKPKNYFHVKYFDEKLKLVEMIDNEEKDQLRQKILKEKDSFVEAVTEMRDQTSKEYEELEKIHYEQLHHFLQHAIDIVVLEHANKKAMNGNFLDDIEEQMHRAERQKQILVCTYCHQENSMNKIVCIKCKRRDGIKEARTKKNASEQTTTEKKSKAKTEQILLSDINDTKEDNSHDRYDHIETSHEDPISVTIGEPTFLNPNSNEAVTLILRHIGINCGLKRYGSDEREWTFVCCDGRPHSLYQKILEEAVLCNHCNQSFFTRQAYKEHHKSDHLNTTPSCSREFDWLYMRIGAGHLEMNAFKAFFELNWSPYLEKMSELMGFTSENAKKFAKNCKDHHVTWQLLLTFHTSALREMVIPFVRSLDNTKEEATVENYFKYYKTFLAHNPNKAYLHLQVCRFSQSLINLRLGLRRNNAQLVRSAKFHLKELFYGRNHPHYQNIELFDSIQYMFMPDEVKAVWDKNISFTVSGDKSRGQDLDFVLEEKNKAIKQYLPSGSVPSNDTWKTICCNLNFFETIQKNLTNVLGLNQQSDYGTKSVEISSAINTFRPILRSYLSKTSNCLTSVQGKKLNSSLVSFLELSTIKRQNKIDSSILGRDVERMSAEPVFVTEDEQENYQKKLTKQELIHRIKNIIETLDNGNLHDHYNAVLESLNQTSTNRNTYLTLYFELKDVFNSQDVIV